VSPRSRLLALLLLPLLAFGQDLQVRAKGYGPTKDASSRAARRAALEQGIGQMITSSTVMENFMVKKDEVITRTEGFVKSFQVLSQSQGPDGAWETELIATVNRDGIQDALASMCILVDAIGKPRVAVLVNEKALGETQGEGSTSEAQLITYFKDRCFEVVEPTDALRAAKAGELKRASQGDATAAAGIGSELGAEIVVAGNVVAKEGDMSSSSYFQGSGMKQASATVSLRVFDVNTREILASRNGSAPMVDPNPQVAASKAIERAVQKVLGKDQLSDDLMKTWKHKANDGQLIRIQVHNIPNYLASQTIQEELRTQAVRVSQRKLADGSLWADVQWRGTVDDFCAAVDQMKINKDRNTLVVKSAEGNTVELEVK
jgi:curli biogenesis system outer membrane secretion channel CsgG